MPVRALGLIVLVLVIVGIGRLAWRGNTIPWLPHNVTEDATRVANASMQDAAVPLHKLIYYEPQIFFDGATEVKTTSQHDVGYGGKIAGGIIPHHLLPGFIYSDFFTRLQKQSPKRIVLIGPNHKEKGGYKVLTSLYGWETPFGAVAPDLSATKKLIGIHAAYVDEGVLEDEHSVAGMMSYIKFYLPDAKVVPLVLRSTLTEGETRQLAKDIASIVDGDTVVVAPVDFSHYLTADEAASHDVVTLDVMRRYDYTSLFAMGNANVDSPPSIAAFLMTMQELQTTTGNLIYNTNSGILLRNKLIKTTSYFSIIYH